MIQSMTGYASYERNTNNGVLQVELRSVNQRYLELQPKLDENCRALEPIVRETLKTRLGRGKVECRMQLAPTQSSDAAIELNHEVLQQIATSMQEAGKHFPDSQPANILEVLRMPGVMATHAVSAETLAADAITTLSSAVDDLIKARAREGEKLKAVILERLAEIEELIGQVKPMMPDLVKTYRARLLAKLEEAQLSNDDERIRQEITLYTQRIDVDEELSRLDAHVSEVKRILSAGGLAGKKLDFLMQEMNREANTLGSKSVAIETTQISMQLKVLVEQMREQIQNIE